MGNNRTRLAGKLQVTATEGYAESHDFKWILTSDV